MTSDYEPPSMSRREAMSASSAAAVAVGSGLLAQSLIGAAAAQTAEPRISLGPDWVIDDDPDGSGHFVIEHTPNGNEYRFRDDGRLVLTEADIGQLAAALDANGQDIQNVGALDTGDLSNPNEASALNRVEFQYLARIDAPFWFYTADTIDGLAQTTSGTASITLNDTDLRLSTGGTSSSMAKIQRDANSNPGYIGGESWDSDRTLRIPYRILDSDADRTDYITTGDAEGGTAGFGFKINNQDLIGVVHNGTSETTTTLQTTVGTFNSKDLRAELSAGSQVEFFVDGTSEGTISSGLPSGGSNAENLFTCSVENSTGADRRSLFSDVRVVQAP